MPESGWQRHGWAIGRQEFRRTVRALRGDTGRLALLGLSGLFFGAMVLGGTYAILQVGHRAGSVTLTNGIRGSIGLQWLFAAFILGQRAGSRHDRIDAESLMLVTVSPRSIVAGLLTAEFLRLLAYVGPIALLLGGAFVYASGSPLAAPAIAVAVVLFCWTALTVGYAAGIGAKLLIARVRFVAKHKTAIGVGIVIAFFGLYALFQGTADGATALLGWLPFAWLADLAMVGSPVGYDPARAAVAAVGSLGWIAVWLFVTERLAAAYWFGDSVEAEIREEKQRVDSGTADDPLTAAVRPLALPTITRPATTIARRSIVVARRNPSRLTFLMLPLIFLGSMLFSVAREGELFTVLAPLLAIAIPWLAGGVFGLNPFGDESAVLPATLTALASGRDYALGLALPGLTYGLPLTVISVLTTGVVGPFAPWQLGALALLGCVLTCQAVTVAPAIGMTFPRFDPIRMGREKEVVPPALSAVVLYSIAIGSLGALAAGAVVTPVGTRWFVAALVGGLLAFPFAWLGGQGVPLASDVAIWLGELGRWIGSLSPATVRWGGYLVALVAAAVLCVLGFVLVRRRFRRYTMA